MHFNPLSQEFAKNPYVTYASLRANNKPFYFADQDMWMLSRYEDVSQVALSPHAVRSLVGVVSQQELDERQRKANWHDIPYHERFVQFSMLDSDGDIHTRLRLKVLKSFTSTSINHLEPMVNDFVDGLLSKIDHDNFDFIEEFAAQIPGYVIAMLLGAPVEDCKQLRVWSERIVSFFDIDRTDDRKQAAESATKDFYDYLVKLRETKKRHPGQDLISRMIVDEAEGEYSEDEFISTCMLILMAGHGSTIDALGNGMHLLLRHPEAMAQLRIQPELFPQAIQEIFRYESPLPFFHRHITNDITIRGHDFPAGTTFGLLYGSANRDERQFAQADEFDIKRAKNRHVAFGRGVHLCLGNHLARMNMNIAFKKLLDRFSHFDILDQDVIYKRGLSVRGPAHLNLKCTRN